VARAALLLLILTGLVPAARAAPGARQRVVLADPDPELRHAIEHALAPWHLEVVIEGPAPADAAIARQRADAGTARFVVWRDGGQLVVYDRELETTERRDAPSGRFDPPTAAAAALTIKTMMRLPPPPAVGAEPVATEPAVRAIAAPTPGPEVRIQLAVATRITRGDTTQASARLAGAVALRPWGASGWRFGVAVDGGTAPDVDRAGFKGTWNEWGALAVVGWTATRGAWEIEPQVGVGVRRSTLDGREMNTPRRETATLPALRGGLGLRRRAARWTFGAQLAIDASVGTSTYTKAGAAAKIFEIPGLAVELGAVLAVDL